MKKISPSRSDPLIWAVKGIGPAFGKTMQLVNDEKMFFSLFNWSNYGLFVLNRSWI